MGLPRSAGARIAKALATKPKPTLVWLEFQDCAADTESLLRASRPTAADVILDLLSIDYHETLMAAAGHRAHQALDKVVETKKGEYIVVVEGSIPLGADGAYCTIGGRSALQIARDVCKDAAAVVAVGTCAAYGGLPAAAPNPTEAVSVADAVPGIKTLINMPACPVNAENLTALISYYLTFDRWPPTDRLGRPLFAYGKSIHDACERRAHFDAGQYVEMWGDQAHRDGACLYKMGCKGPATFHNCPNVRWNEGDELAGRLRPPVHRLRRARVLGPDDAVLPPPPGHPGLQRCHQHRPGRAVRRRGGRRRHGRPHLDPARQAHARQAARRACGPRAAAPPPAASGPPAASEPPAAPSTPAKAEKGEP